MEDYSKPRYMSQDAIAAEQQRFMVRVYNWMGAGLALTGAMAWFTSTNETILNILVTQPILFIVLLVVELGLVFYLAARVMSMSASQAMGVFFLYAGLNGVTLAPLFLLYTSASLASTFLVTAGTVRSDEFLRLHYQEGPDLLGQFSVHGIDRHNYRVYRKHGSCKQPCPLLGRHLHWGSLIFVGLTAYDTQKIKEMNILGNEGTEEDTKEADLVEPCRLYLDFILLFIIPSQDSRRPPLI